MAATQIRATDLHVGTIVVARPWSKGEQLPARLAIIVAGEGSHLFAPSARHVLAYFYGMGGVTEDGTLQAMWLHEIEGIHGHVDTWDSGEMLAPVKAELDEAMEPGTLLLRQLLDYLTSTPD